MPRIENLEADTLAKLTVGGEQHLTQGFSFEEINCPVVEQEESLLVKVKNT